MSNAEYALLYVLAMNRSLLSDAHRIYLFVLFLLCHVFRSSEFVIITGAASHFNMIISIPKKQVLKEGEQQQQSVTELKNQKHYSSHTVRLSTLCVLFILENMISDENWKTVYS